jgi:hypothetical protein
MVRSGLYHISGCALLRKHVYDHSPVHNGKKQGDILLPLFFNFALEESTGKTQLKPGETGINWDISAAGLRCRCESSGR